MGNKLLKGWKRTYKASSIRWCQDIRGGRWILVRGRIRSRQGYRMRKVPDETLALFIDPQGDAALLGSIMEKEVANGRSDEIFVVQPGK